MTFTYQRMTLPPFLSKNLCTQHPMTDIRFCTETLDAWGIATEDADIMKHGGFLEKFLIKPQLRMGLCNLQTAVCHLTTVY
jgi:hypothetical protein